MMNSRVYAMIGTSDGTTFTDDDVVNGDEYCYYVVAVNTVGDSDPSNTDCATPYVDPGDIVTLDVTDGGVEIGATGSISVNMENTDPVAGFQFTLSFDPDIASVVSVSATDRTAGFSISEGNGVIIGFSLTGAAIESGTGAIVDIEISGDALVTAEAGLSDIV